MMRTVKQTQTKQTSNKKSPSDSNKSQNTKDEHTGKQGETASLKAFDCTTKRMCTMKKLKPELMKLRDKSFKREPHEDSNMTNAECETKVPRSSFVSHIVSQIFITAKQFWYII